MYKIVILPPAKQDIEEAANWYNKRQSGLVEVLPKEIKLKTYLLKNNLFGYSIRYQNIRVSTVDRFPFLIHFKIDKATKILLITAVLHTSRNPKIWNKRLK